MTQNSRTGDLTSGPMLQKIILFSLPLAASSILQLLFNAADVVVVGRFAGSTALAAVGDRNKMLAHLAAEFELSEREKEALICMDGGMTNAQIAENMGISLSTVKKHVYHIFEKVGVDTRAQLRNVLETYNSTKF